MAQGTHAATQAATYAACGRALLAALVGAVALLIAATDLAAAAPARTTADLNLRTGPGTQYRVILAMPRGSLVDVGRCVPRWCEVSYRGRVGWASSRYLRQGGRPGPVYPAPAPAPVYPGTPFPFPFPFPFPDVDPRPDYPTRGICRERPARWLIGERATERRLQAALDASGARRLRVEEPGRFYTQDYREDRLTVTVNRRDIVVDVECR
ncbi:SH3 domain-containing protein [Salinarimonas sp.]|uniref:SH3 domain-containing protein n=1 Tax=Salinarimonas sp. TaxID=2766526 RepID=UPI0032D94493